MSRVGEVALGGGLADRRRSWRRTRFAAVDLETTGLDPARDAIVAYGVVPVEDALVRLDLARGGLVAAGRPVTRRAVEVHGIRPVDLVDARPVAEAGAALREALEGTVPLAWTSWVEAAFLPGALGGRPSAWFRRIVDVRRLAMLLDHLLGRQPSPAATEALAATAARFGVPPDLEHHALWDAFVTAQLFVVVATHLERLRRGSVGALVSAGVGRTRLDPRRPPVASPAPVGSSAPEGPGVTPA